MTDATSTNASIDRSRLTKNGRIKETLLETRARRQQQVCKTYELKVDLSHVSKKTNTQLRRLFLEAKWFYNDLLARGRVPAADYKLKDVLVRNKNGALESRTLQYLSSQIRQEIMDRAKDNIRGLSALKRRGHKVGALKFKSRFTSIPLKQYGKTHRLEANRVRIQNISQPLKVMGREQIPSGAELTSATLVNRGEDYFIHLATFQARVEKQRPRSQIGIDFGVAKQLVLSDGLSIEEGVPQTKQMRSIHRELSRRTLYSKNWRKSLVRLNLEFERIGRQKQDIRNKIVSRLVSTYQTIAVQDDNMKGWQKMWGRRMRASSIGGIMGALRERAHTLIEVPRGSPTTKRCSHCGVMREIALGQRTFRCLSCGCEIDRDLNSAINILKEGVPAERRELTPVDTRATIGMMEYFKSIPGVSASLVVEAGSPRRAVVR